jgi:hypothetical protein
MRSNIERLTGIDEHRLEASCRVYSDERVHRFNWFTADVGSCRAGTDGLRVVQDFVSDLFPGNGRTHLIYTAVYGGELFEILLEER